MKNQFEQIKQEIISFAGKERAAVAEARQRKEVTKGKLDFVRDQMSAALAAGNLEQYKAAGAEEISLRFELDYLEKKSDVLKPAADKETDKRIQAGLRSESARIRADALAQLKQIFTEASDVVTETLKQLDGLDKLFSEWDLTVMHRDTAQKAANSNDGLMFAQFGTAAKTQLERFKYIVG